MSDSRLPEPAVVQRNLAAWQRLARHHHRLTRAARDEDFADPLASVDGPGWLGRDLQGQRVLCLAAGGGRQGPLYAAAGAVVTVVDFCQELLDRDREVADRRQLVLRTLRTCMTDLSALDDQSFDLVIHPVSTCYVANLARVYQEVARVLRGEGLYISQHKQPASLQVGIDPDPDGSWRLRQPYYRQAALPAIQQDNLVREPGAEEYIHPWQSLMGEMCRAGFVIEDLTEPFHADPAAPVGSFAHRSQYLPPYVRIKARRKRDSQGSSASSSLWIPPEETEIS